MTNQANVTPGKALTESAMQGLQNRSIDLELASQFGVVSAKPSWRIAPDENWIGFPHLQTKNGKRDVVHWSFRTVSGEKKFFMQRGAKGIFWNVDVISDPTLRDEPLVITEGCMDAIPAIDVGYVRTVSVPNGASDKRLDPDEYDGDFYDFLDLPELMNPEHPNYVQEIVLAVDNDGPGTNLLFDLALRLGHERCKWVRFPRGCKDPRDVFEKHGPEALREALDNRRWVAVEGLYEYDDLPPTPPMTVLDVGMPGLEEIWKPALRHLTILTGVPGHGKSTMMVEIMARLADKGRVVVVAVFENDVKHSLCQKLMRWKFMGDPKNASAEQYDKLEDWIRAHFKFIVYHPASKETPTVQWYLDRVKIAVVRYNAKFAVVDPWNRLDHTVRPSNMTAEQYDMTQINKFDMHCKEFNYASVIIAHPKKPMADTNREPLPPTGYSISGAAHWFNMPSSGITVHWHRSDYARTEMMCWKARENGEIGTAGASMSFNFVPEENRYYADPQLHAMAKASKNA